jgi:hypothetical protein
MSDDPDPSLNDGGLKNRTENAVDEETILPTASNKNSSIADTSHVSAVSSAEADMNVRPESVTVKYPTDDNAEIRQVAVKYSNEKEFSKMQGKNYDRVPFPFVVICCVDSGAGGEDVAPVLSEVDATNIDEKSPSLRLDDPAC